MTGEFDSFNREPTMSIRVAILTCLVLSTILTSGCGCRRIRMKEYRAVSARAAELYDQTVSLQGEIGSYQSSLAHVEQEKAQMAEESARLQSSLKIAEERIANLTGERGELHGRYEDLLTGGGNRSPLSDEATRRLQELAERHPQLEFDPATGVSKFSADLLFNSGSDIVRDEGDTILQEFASLVNAADTQGFSILVVGHTDDKPIRRAGLAARFETNWELSAHRATQVVRRLAKYGVQEYRMGAAGYSKYQPVSANVDEPSRQENRRVEIYLLAADSQVASFDPSVSR